MSGNICPLCIEEFDITDKTFRPCKCGYQMCVWCWSKIVDMDNPRCPHCREPYNPNEVYQPDDKESFEREIQESLVKQRKEKAHKKRLRKKERHKHDVFAPAPGVYVLSRRTLTCSHIQPELCNEDSISKYFRPFGSIAEINIQNAGAGTKIVYVAYKGQQSSAKAVAALNGKDVDGHIWRIYRSSSRYCGSFQNGKPCRKPYCTFLHARGKPEDVYIMKPNGARLFEKPPVPVLSANNTRAQSVGQSVPIPSGLESHAIPTNPALRSPVTAPLSASQPGTSQSTSYSNITSPTIAAATGRRRVSTIVGSPNSTSRCTAGPKPQPYTMAEAIIIASSKPTVASNSPSHSAIPVLSAPPGMSET
eukprot:991870_1